MVIMDRGYRSRKRLAATLLLAAVAAPLAAQEPAPKPPTANYWLYVGAESADLIHRIRFGPGGMVVEKTIPIGESATEMEGPHGLQISPDGKYLHMTTGHGSPDGKYWRYVLGPDTLAGPGIFLGFFPASLDVTPDGLYAFVANFNLHGEMVPSTVSVVYTPDRTEVAQITTCTMPHGSRVTGDGQKQYSTCMMDDQLVEIDTRTLKVSRRFSLATGKEGPLAADAVGEHGAHAGHAAAGAPKPAMTPATCSPTWAQPSVDGKKIYVACNKRSEILEIDRDAWKVTRRIATGPGVYNLAASPDGRWLVASLKSSGQVDVYDLAATDPDAHLWLRAWLGKLAHGVTISSDSRYAFVSVEGVGAEPGKVWAIDLAGQKAVASVNVGQQASGITFWKQEPAAK